MYNNYVPDTLALYLAGRKIVDSGGLIDPGLAMEQSRDLIKNVARVGFVGRGGDGPEVSLADPPQILEIAERNLHVLSLRRSLQDSRSRHRRTVARARGTPGVKDIAPVRLKSAARDAPPGRPY